MMSVALAYDVVGFFKVGVTPVAAVYDRRLLFDGLVGALRAPLQISLPLQAC